MPKQAAFQTRSGLSIGRFSWREDALTGQLFSGQFNIVERLGYKGAFERAGLRGEGEPHLLWIGEGAAPVEGCNGC